MVKDSKGICDMCGHFVIFREDAHIIEDMEKNGNILELCPSCHHMFDHHLKRKIYEAVNKTTEYKLPHLWKKNPYQRAAEKSAEALKQSEEK